MHFLVHADQNNCAPQIYSFAAQLRHGGALNTSFCATLVFVRAFYDPFPQINVLYCDIPYYYDVRL